MTNHHHQDSCGDGARSRGFAAAQCGKPSAYRSKLLFSFHPEAEPQDDLFLVEPTGDGKAEPFRTVLRQSRKMVALEGASKDGCPRSIRKLAICSTTGKILHLIYG